MKKILIIGVGPAGGILTAHLANSGFNVTCVDIFTDIIENIKKKGLRICNKLCTKIPNSFTSITDAFHTFKDYDLIFICVKATALIEVVSELKPFVSPNSKIICCMNGLDVEDIVAVQFNPCRAFRMIVNYGGNLIEPGEINMTFFNKPNYIGALTDSAKDSAKEIADILSRADLDTIACDNIKKHAWEKAIRNAIMAPICALTGGNISQMFNFPPTRALTEGLLIEGISVAKATGCDLPDNFFESSIDYISKGGRHKPSMLIDIVERRKTEISFINGKIVEYGQKYKIPTPYNTAITTLVLAREKISREK